MINAFLGRTPIEDVRPNPATKEIREATHALNNAAAKLAGACSRLREETDFALAEFERRMQRRD